MNRHQNNKLKIKKLIIKYKQIFKKFKTFNNKIWGNKMTKMK